MHFTRLWEEITDLVDRALDSFLPGAEEFPRTIHEAMRYSVFAGGKRIRPLLLILTTKLFSEEWRRSLPVACALELIHTYSLIHDDLPAMDNDDYRRGKPTAHRLFGEAMAILAGDALLTLAFALLCGQEDQNNEYYTAYRREVPPAVKLQIIGEMAGASGVRGMIAGQVLDLEAEGQTVAVEMLNDINARKTGALIVAAVRSGALLGEAPAGEMQLLSDYASLLGRGFQIVDDLLDVEGNEKKMGKQKGMDKKRNKATVVSLYGVAEAKKLRDNLYAEALAELFPFGKKADALRKLTRFVFYRDY
ncbi:MAG: polyprenyl synthetase family protein [Bacillota bacterium]